MPLLQELVGAIANAKVEVIDLTAPQGSVQRLPTTSTAAARQSSGPKRRTHPQ